jgi:zinc protease
LVRKYFGSLANPDTAPKRPVVPVPDHADALFSIETDPELPFTTVTIAYKREAREERTEADYRRQMVERLYASMFNDRLSEKIQQADPPFLGAGVGDVSLVRSKDVFFQNAVVREGSWQRGLTELLWEARRVGRDGFTASELERAKAEMLRGYEQAYNERDKTESTTYADEYVRNFLEGEPAPGIAKELEMARRFLQDITLDEVNASTRDWITPRNRVVLYSSPAKPQLPVPNREEILSVVQAAEKAEVAAYDDGLSNAPLLPREPQPGRIVAESRHDRIDVTEWRLSNGARVLLKPTDFKNDQILLRGFSPGGHSLSPDTLFVPASTASSVVGQSGVGAFNAIQLPKKLAGKIARVSTHIDSQFENLSGFASPTDIVTFFELAYLRLTGPRADADTFGSMQAQMREMIENRRNDPDAVFEDAFEKTFYRDHPRHQPLSLEMVNRMDREASLRFYRERFSDLGDFTFVFVGNFTLDQMRPLVERYLASLPSAGRKEQGRFNGDDPVRGVRELVVRKGIEQKASVQILFTGDTEWSEEARYPLRAAVDVLRIRLREELREDMGGVYGVGVSGNLARWPKGTYQCSIQFGCDPAKADALIQAALTEVKSLQENGPSDVNLAKVKEQHLRQFEVDQKENAFWLNNLGFRAQYGLPLPELLDFPEKARNLTADAVQQAARKYFSTNNVFTARLLPEAAAAATNPPAK